MSNANKAARFGDWESPIIVVGPSLVGKSTWVTRRADNNAFYGNEEAVVVNADKYYMFAGPNFWLGLGLEPDDRNVTFERRLFGHLDPHDRVPTQEEYMQQVGAVLAEIHAEGRRAIIEGCSKSYGAALIGHFGSLPTAKVVRMTFSPEQRRMVIPKVAESFGKLVELGMYAETQDALDRGYRDAFPMGGLLYRSVLQALAEGDTDQARNNAEWLAIRNWTNDIQRTDEFFAKIASSVDTYYFDNS